MSVRSRELSQFGSFINVNDSPTHIGITSTSSSPFVGVGTNNPISKLHVIGNVNVSGSVTATSFIGDGSALTNLPIGGSYSQWEVSASGIHTSSNVGIGSTIPTSKLEVVGDANVSGVITATAFYGDGSELTGIVSSKWDSGASGIHTSSNVGIGTTNPTSRLQIVGDANVSGVITATAIYGDGSNLINLQGRTQWDSGASGIHTSSNVGIGTTNPTSKLQVVGDANISGVVTATSFVGDGSGLVGIVATNSGVEVRNNDSILGTASTINFTSNIQASFLNGTATITNTKPSQFEVTSIGIHTLSNTGIGTTNPTSKLTVTGDALITGVITASSFSGNATSATTADYATSAGSASVATNLANAANITTGTINSARLSGSYNINIAGTATTATNLADAANITTGTINSSRLSGSYNINIAGTATTATNVIGGIGSISQLRVTGLSTFVNGPVLIGSATSTGTGSQPLQITGSAYISGNTGIGTTRPTSNLYVVGTSLITGISTFNSNVTFNDSLIVSAGSVSSPSIRVNDTDTGFYSSGVGDITVTANSQNVVSFDSTRQYNYGDVYLTTTNDIDASAGTSLRSSSYLYLRGKYWDGAASQNQTWRIVNVSLNTTPTSRLTFQWASGAGTYSSALNLQDNGNLLIYGSLIADSSNSNLDVFSTNATTITAFTAATNLLMGATTGIATIRNATVNLTGNTASTSTTTGTLVVTGGAGISGNLNVGSNIDVTGRFRVAGISTFTSGPVLIGSATSTGTAAQRLQVTGTSYFSDTVGIGSTNTNTSFYKLFVVGNVGSSSEINGKFIGADNQSNPAAQFNRDTTTGTLVNLNYNNVTQGTIVVASDGTTINYNSFLGSHWAMLSSGEVENILPGTIMESINELVDWKLISFNKNGEVLKQCYNGNLSVGSAIIVNYENEEYLGIIEKEEPDNDIEKSVRVKVSESEGSSAVYGVFLCWNTDDDKPYIGRWNNMSIASVGNYFIRMNGGEEVEIGDLIESAGNGCGRVQGDDIIRSKTVGKITSTIKQKIYDDGSYLVTAVLYCG